MLDRLVLYILTITKMKYKHKKLGWIAEYIDATWPYYRTEDSHFYISPKLIEESNDRELIEEKDWIDNFFLRIPALNDKKLFREYINKHLPKITEEELRNIEIEQDIHISKIRNLLKSKWLLAE